MCDWSKVNLDWSEIDQAAHVGKQRQMENLKEDRKHAYGAQGGGWQKHILGAIGEMAVARYFGTYWNGYIGNLDMPDVGGVEVRSVDRKKKDLIVHKPDPDHGKGDSPDDVFVLAIVSSKVLPTVLLPGWTMGRKAQKERFWEDRKGNGRYAYFYDKEYLLSMERMKKAVTFEPAPVS